MIFLEWQKFSTSNFLELRQNDLPQKTYNFLEDYYNGLVLNFEFQIFQMSNFADFGERKKLELSGNERILLQEQSACAGLKVFGPLNLDPWQLDILLYNYEQLKKNRQYFGDFDCVLYIRTSPEVCFKRIQYRHRVEERNRIDMDLLQRLHEKHESWLEEKFFPNVPKDIIVLDGNQSIKELVEDGASRLKYLFSSD